MSDPLDHFARRVENLVSRFEQGVDRREWATRRYPKKFRDSSRQIREIPALYLQKGPVKLLLDPIGHDVPGAEGVVDIYLMPTYDPEASVYFEDGEWVIYHLDRSEVGAIPSLVEPQKLPLTDEAINNVLDSIAAHVEPTV